MLWISLPLAESLLSLTWDAERAIGALFRGGGGYGGGGGGGVSTYNFGENTLLGHVPWGAGGQIVL